MRLVLLGPPGVGKGTQARRIAKLRSIPQIATGDILREAIQEGTSVGQKAKEFMDAGKLVPDDVVITIISERLQKPDARNGFVLDGFPRTVPQAQALDDILKDRDLGLDCVFFLAAPDEVLIERISGRRTCRNCQAMYHVKHAPPKKENVCDACQGELYQREDDREEAVRERLRMYDERTKDLIAYYDAAGILLRINAARTADEIFKEIRSALF